jgi:hypothetical protein
MRVRLEQALNLGAAAVTLAAVFGLDPLVAALSLAAKSHTPANRCVRFAAAVTDDHATLATGRPATALPGPVSHRLERASFS